MPAPKQNYDPRLAQGQNLLMEALACDQAKVYEPLKPLTEAFAEKLKNSFGNRMIKIDPSTELDMKLMMLCELIEERLK